MLTYTYSCCEAPDADSVIYRGRTVSTSTDRETILLD